MVAGPFQDDTLTPMTTAISPNTTNGFHKDKLSGYRRIVAQSLAHAGRIHNEETGEVHYTISFLVINGNASVRYNRRCTKEVFKKCYGRHPDNDPNTLPVGGWCTQIGRKYYVYVSGKKPEDWFVERVSSFPETVYTAKTAPEALMDQDNLELQYDPDGSFHVVYRKLNRDVSLPVYPTGLSLQEFGNLTSELDKKEILTVGDRVTGGDGSVDGWHIANVAGSRVMLQKY
jgi:hypothetical protein